MHSQLTRADARIFNPSRFLQVALLAALVLGIGATVACAQSEAATQDSENSSEQAGKRQMQSVDDQLQKLTQALSLSDDQQAKIKPILENQRTQMQAIRSDSSGSRRDNFAKMRDVHEKTVNQVKEVLNDDQEKKYDEIQDQMKEGRKHRRQH